MTLLEQREVSGSSLEHGEFNDGEHLFIAIEPGKNQTVSCRLPNGEFVTFAFVPAGETEFECVDVHSTVGKKFKYKDTDTDEDVHFVQHALGFSRYGDTFDTRTAGKPTGLVTLLLNGSHHR